jgi:hypothetical protein
MADAFTMELCGSRGAWQIVPEGVTRIIIEEVAERIEADGYTVGLQSRLMWTFSGPSDLSLFPSGKLLVKTQDKDLAADVARRHLEAWIPG